MLPQPQGIYRDRAYIHHDINFQAVRAAMEEIVSRFSPSSRIELTATNFEEGKYPLLLATVTMGWRPDKRGKKVDIDTFCQNFFNAIAEHKKNSKSPLHCFRINYKFLDYPTL